MALNPFNSLVSKLSTIPKTVLREWLLLAISLCFLGGVMSSRQSLAPLDAIWFDAIIASKPLPVPDALAAECTIVLGHTRRAELHICRGAGILPAAASF